MELYRTFSRLPELHENFGEIDAHVEAYFHSLDTIAEETDPQIEIATMETVSEMVAVLMELSDV